MQGLSRAHAGTEGSVAGTFRSVVDAERALEALRAQGIPPDRVSMVMGESNAQFGVRNPELALPGDGSTQPDNTGAGERAGEGRGTNVGGGAATGATLGGLVGILWGWISGSSVATVPGAVAAVSSGILSSTITGLAIGVAVGGLVGALVGAGMSEIDAPEGEDGSRERRILVTVLVPGDGVEKARATLIAQGATEVQTISDGGFGISDYDDAATQQAATNPASEVQNSISDVEESYMADEVMGRDPESITGTKDAIDPETGVLGTAGTPVTDGYGVSGSTIGTGSARGQSEQEGGDFKGEQPDSDAYDKGGRGSDDVPDEGRTYDTAVESKHTDTRVDEAPVQSEPDTRDIYEKGPSYGTPTEDVASDASAADVDNSSTQGNAPAVSNESGGNNTPGTSDVRGLGDNTDEA